NTDPPTSEVCEAPDAGGGVDVERVPVVTAAQENRQGRPIPFLAVSPFPGQERLRDGHLRDVELVVGEVPLEEVAGIERDAVELDALRLHESIFQRLH